MVVKGAHTSRLNRVRQRRPKGVIPSGFSDTCGSGIVRWLFHCISAKKVTDFDPVRDGKTITQFCNKSGRSRQTYAHIKNRVPQNGQSGILPDSTAPKNRARKFDDTVKIAVINARQHLLDQGIDYGAWSIYYYLFDSAGADRTPSRSTIALWLHELGFVDANARKPRRNSYKRFASDFVGDLRQIDGLV